jgi:Proliferating cell nuclear antigen, N-terminal domain
VTGPEPPAWPVFSATAGAHAWRSIVKVLEPLGGSAYRRRGGPPEVLLTVDARGIHVRHVDPSHVAMVVLDIPGSALAPFTVDTPGAVGFDLAKLAEFLRVPTGHAPVTLWTEPAPEPRDRRVRMRTGHVTRVSSSVDPSGITEPKIPELDPKARAYNVDAGEFARAVKEAAKTTDHALIRRSREGLVVIGPGNDVGSETVSELSAGQVTGGGTGKYPLDFLGPMSAAIARADPLTLGWGREYPARITFTAGEVVPDGYEYEGRRKRRAERRVDWYLGAYLLAARVDRESDGPDYEGWWARPFDRWYSWAMRIPDRAGPELGAAAADAIPDTVYVTERETVDAWNRNVDAQYAADLERYAAELAAWPATEARQRETWEHNEAVKVAQLADWRAAHPRAVKKRPPRALSPEDFRATGRPFAPIEPTHRHREPFDGGLGARYHHPTVPDADRRRALRGRNESGISWGPARPKPAAPVGPVAEVAVSALARPEPEPGFMSTYTPAVALAMVRAAEPDPETDTARVPEILETDLDPDELPASEPDGAEAWVAERRRALEAAGDPDGVLVGPDPGPATEPEEPGRAVVGASEEMIRAFDIPREVCAPPRPDPEPEAPEPEPTVPDAPKVPFREPIPAPIVGQMRTGVAGARDCAFCHGTGILDTRRHSYPCPGCGPSAWADAGPAVIRDTEAAAAATEGVVASMVRAHRLAHGRDAA